MNNLSRNYKNTVFCMMFKDKERLLTLYNDMRNRIMTEKDAGILSRWSRLAAKSESIGKFEAQM